MRNSCQDPSPGDVLGHNDGGAMYVFYRSKKIVGYQRKPDGTDYRVYSRLSTFAKLCSGEVIREAKA